MLEITPFSINNIQTKSPAFGYNQESIKEDIDFYKGQVEELDKFASEGYVPEKMKKSYKFFRTIANGVIDGLAVAGSTLMLGNFLKKSSSKLSNNKILNKITGWMKSATNKISEGFNYVGEKISKGFDKLLKTDLYDKFASSKLGKRIIADTSFMVVKAEDFIDKGRKSIGNIKINADKATTGVATILGIGSGVTGAYETAIKDSKNNQNLDQDSETEFREVA